MRWFRRRRQDNPYGYEDRAALKGFGGYEPSESTPTTFGVPPVPTSSEPASTGSATTPGTSPYGGLPSFPESTGEQSEKPAGQAPPDPPRRQRKKFNPVGLIIVVVLGFVWTNIVSPGTDEEDTFPDRPTSPVADPVPETRVLAPPVIDGWQPVVQRDGSYAYDVPPGWEPKPRVVHGWETEEDDFRLATSAFVAGGRGDCAAEEDYEGGGSGLQVADGRDAGTAAAETVKRLAEFAYTPEGGRAPDVAVGTPEPVELSFGGSPQQASMVFAEVTVTEQDSDACLPATATVGALAVPTPSDAFAVIAVYDGPDTTTGGDRTQLTRLLTSLRTPDDDELTTTVVTPSR